ncbi:MAG: hypothetical protein R2794_12585 [Chitinophagales bacterium]
MEKEEIIAGKNANYTAENIQVLEGLEAVRKKACDVIGDTGFKVASPGV